MAMSDSIAALGYGIPDVVLKELVCRFTANIPEEEKVELVRVSFQIELAHWYFVDNYCQPGSELDHLTHIPFNIFTLQMFEFTPYLRAHVDKVEEALTEFRAYKNKVPVYGAILLTEDMDEVLLVQGFKNQWGFPKGKVNKEEDDSLCAVREVLEETGYDATDLINRNHYIESSQNDRLTRLYILVGVERDFPFRPRTSYEIKQISWFHINELPDNRKDLNVTPRDGYSNANFYTVFSYVRRLKRWIADKVEGTNKLLNFKATENYSKNTNLQGIEFPNVPIRPVFPNFPLISSLTSPHPPLTPQKSSDVHRRLNFNGFEDSLLSTPRKLNPDTSPFQRMSLSLSMLFGQTAYDQLSGFIESSIAEERKPALSDFFSGLGASAWLKFKLDPEIMLTPWTQKKS